MDKNRLLYICDLESNPLTSIEKTLENLDHSIQEIVLHYAYQIPKNTASVIEVHDKIKNNAAKKLEEMANNIFKSTGINTSIKLSLGTNENTLKRLLTQNNFNYVSLSENKVPQKLIKEFSNVKFIILSNLKSA